MEEKLNTIQSLIGALNSPIAQRKGVTISPEHCKIWVEELSKFMQESGWHPASELPPVDEDGNSEKVVGIRVFPEGIPTGPFFVKVVDNEWNVKYVTWWCYPPKEE